MRFLGAGLLLICAACGGSNSPPDGGAPPGSDAGTDAGVTGSDGGADGGMDGGTDAGTGGDGGIPTIQLVAQGGRASWSVNDVIAYDHVNTGTQRPVGYYEVYTIRPDGGANTCLTCTGSAGASVLPPYHMGNPKWSRDGKFLVFQVEAYGTGDPLADYADFPAGVNGNDLWATDTLGHFWQLTNQVYSDGLVYSALVFSGQDTALPDAGTWTTTGCTGTGAAGTFTATGGNLATVTITARGSGYVCSPTFMPSSGSLGTSKVAFVGAGSVIQADFSWGGTELAWGQRVTPYPPASKPYGKWELNVATFTEDGGVPALSNTVSYAPGTNQLYYEPHTWSLDDSTVFFMGDLDPGMATFAMNIYSYDLDAGVLTNLTNTLTNWYEYPLAVPASPFGTHKLVYMFYDRSVTPCRSDYWVMNDDGTTPYQLTFFNTPGTPYYDAAQPVCMDDHSWSPDGTRLVAFTNDFAANGHTGYPGPDWILDIADVAGSPQMILCPPYATVGCTTASGAAGSCTCDSTGSQCSVCQ